MDSFQEKINDGGLWSSLADTSTFDDQGYSVDSAAQVPELRALVNNAAHTDDDISGFDTLIDDVDSSILALLDNPARADTSDILLNFGVSAAQPGQQIADILFDARVELPEAYDDRVTVPEPELVVVPPLEDAQEVIIALRMQIKALANKPQYRHGLKKIHRDCARILRPNTKVTQTTVSNKCERCKSRHYTIKTCGMRTDGKPCACCKKAGISNCKRAEDNRYLNAPNGRWSASKHT